MKQLVTFSTLLILFLFAGNASGQDFRTLQYVGTPSDGQCVRYDGVTDNRFEPGQCIDGLEDAETPTDDSVPVGNGTGFDSKVLPDCDDSTGNHLNYDTATNAFTCGTTSSVTDTGPSPDCSGTLTYQDGEGGCDTYTLSGNTTSLGTTSGTLTSGDCAEFDASGNLIASGGACGGSGDITDVGTCTSGACFTDGTNHSLTFEGATTDIYETTVSATDPTADRTITLPNASGGIILDSMMNTEAELENIVGGTNIITENDSVFSISDVADDDSGFTIAVGCAGACSGWAANFNIKYTKNLADTCVMQLGMTTAASISGGNATYLTVTGYLSSWPWDVVNTVGNLYCGSAYISNDTDAVREIGYVFAQDNGQTLYIYRDALAQFVSGKSYRVYTNCVFECDPP